MLLLRLSIKHEAVATRRLAYLSINNEIGENSQPGSVQLQMVKKYTYQEI